MKQPKQHSIVILKNTLQPGLIKFVSTSNLEECLEIHNRGNFGNKVEIVGNPIPVSRPTRTRNKLTKYLQQTVPQQQIPYLPWVEEKHLSDILHFLTK